jgi:hypothetical protein
VKCQHCSKEFSTQRGTSRHARTCVKNPERVKIEVWNKGKTKATTPALAKASETLSRRYRDGLKLNFTQESRENLSRLAKERNLGGYRPHPNKGVLYNGVWFDSKWEERVAKSLDEYQVRWLRPKAGFVWTDSGNKYFPDFFLVDYNVYLDPKNDFLQKKDSLKIAEAQRRNGIKVLVLSEHQLTWDVIQLLC